MLLECRLVDGGGGGGCIGVGGGGEDCFLRHPYYCYANEADLSQEAIEEECHEVVGRTTACLAVDCGSAAWVPALKDSFLESFHPASFSYHFQANLLYFLGGKKNYALAGLTCG